uniref:Uncharacterized protein n=1 Tax=Tanacetum cinerariifolium TaxID=118510 RepID=A0A699ISU3_TANCI|nr:hypothetical protein [Tanacetum cinerariifolium]
MASNPEIVRLSVLAKLQEALDEKDILADQILTMMHRYADRFKNRRVEINNLMVLQDHPLVDYEKVKALGANDELRGSRVVVVWMEDGGGIVSAMAVSRVVLGLVMKVVFVMLRGWEAFERWFWIGELSLEEISMKSVRGIFIRGFGVEELALEAIE